MTPNARTELPLPPPIAAYFAADTADADAVTRCFREDAIVIDEHHTHQGRAAIARWKADATAKYHYTSRPISQETSGGETVVTARVTGEFPGSPAILRYRFTLSGGAIARLEISA
jgi:ketosteroid isomerase-like protein